MQCFSTCVEMNMAFRWSLDIPSGYMLIDNLDNFMKASPKGIIKN